MTKEEAIESMIESYKEGARRTFTNFCDKYANCYECPLNGRSCRNNVVNSLIERLLKAEEHQETNLEHYFEDSSFTDGNGYIIKVRLPWDIQTDNLTKWLLSQYEEPKPKFKLTQFEYDLFDSCFNKAYGVKDSWALDQMHEKGYFKGIPNDISIKDILDNCEVIKDE